MSHPLTFHYSGKRLLLETRHPCEGNRKAQGLKGLTVNSIWHLNSDQLSTSETDSKTQLHVLQLSIGL